MVSVAAGRSRRHRNLSPARYAPDCMPQPTDNPARAGAIPAAPAARRPRAPRRSAETPAQAPGPWSWIQRAGRFSHVGADQPDRRWSRRCRPAPEAALTEPIGDQVRQLSDSGEVSGGPLRSQPFPDAHNRPIPAPQLVNWLTSRSDPELAPPLGGDPRSKAASWPNGSFREVSDVARGTGIFDAATKSARRSSDSLPSKGNPGGYPRRAPG